MVMAAMIGVNSTQKSPEPPLNLTFRHVGLIKAENVERPPQGVDLSHRVRTRGIMTGQPANQVIGVTPRPTDS